LDASDGFGAVLVSGYALDIGRFTLVGEAALMFWPLIKASRTDFSQGKADRGPQLDPDLGLRPPRWD
jgi:hypothetical protein